MKIFIVIAVFNRKAHTQKCLQLLKRQTYKDFEIVLVDDGSEDGTSEMVSSEFPEVHIIRGTGEWWWTKSMNKGIELAINQGAESIMFLNNDTVFDSDMVQKLVEWHRKKPRAIIGSLNTVKGKTDYIFFSGVKKVSWWKAKEHKYHKAFHPYNMKLSGLHPTVCLNGRGTLVPIEVFDAIGGFDEDAFPQYASDYDFVLRAVKKGFEAFMAWDVVVVSDLLATGEGRSFISQPLIGYLKSFRNIHASNSLSLIWHYYRKHAGIAMVTGVPIHILKQCYSFYKKQHTFNHIS